MRLLHRSAVAALAAIVLAAPSASRAGDTYIALKGGVWAPTASDGISTVVETVQNPRLPASGDIELAYGATLGIIGAQIAAGYMWSSATPDTGVTVKTNAIPFYALGQLRLPIFFIQPYLEVGIGGFCNFGSASAGGITSNATKVSFLAIGGAGVDFLLGPILLGAEARYMYITQQTFDWGTLKPSGVNVTLNVGYVF